MGDCCSRTLQVDHVAEHQGAIQPLRATRMTRLSLRSKEGKLMAARGSIQTIHDNLHMMSSASEAQAGHLETTVYAGATELVVYSDYSTLDALHRNNPAERKLLKTVQDKSHVPGDLEARRESFTSLALINELVGHVLWEAHGLAQETDGPWPAGYVHMLLPRQRVPLLVEHVRSRAFEEMLHSEPFAELYDIELVIGHVSAASTKDWFDRLVAPPTCDVFLNFRFSPEERSGFSSSPSGEMDRSTWTSGATELDRQCCPSRMCMRYEKAAMVLVECLEQAVGAESLLSRPTLGAGEIFFVHHSPLQHKRQRESPPPPGTLPLISNLRRSNDELIRVQSEERSRISGRQRDLLWEKVSTQAQPKPVQRRTHKLQSGPATPKSELLL